MSGATIAPYFPFRRIKIINQQVLPDAREARIQAQPDKRFLPICQCCGQKATGIHSWTQRTIRDFEPGNGQSVDQLSVSQAVLCQLPSDQHRGSEAVSSISAGDSPPGALYSPPVPVYDRHRGGSTPAVGLENSQKHRQMVFRASIRSTRLKRAASFSSGRNIDQKRSPLLDHSLGLSQRPRGLCRRASKIQNAGNIFRSIKPKAA